MKLLEKHQWHNSLQLVWNKCLFTAYKTKIQMIYFSTPSGIYVNFKNKVHADFTTWKRFLHYRPVVKEIMRYFPHKESVMWSIHTRDKNGNFCLESVHFMKLLEKCQWHNSLQLVRNKYLLLHTKKMIQMIYLQVQINPSSCRGIVSQRCRIRQQTGFLSCFSMKTRQVTRCCVYHCLLTLVKVVL